MIEQKLPPTILLVGVSFVIQQMLALPLGILAAARQYSLFDGAFSVLSYIALSFPGFVLGLLLLFVFCVHWHLLPVGHYESVEYPLLWSNDWFAAFAADPIGVSRDLALHLMLPAFVLTVTGIAVDGRFMRASMLQVLSHEFIRTARGKGISRRRVIFKHALRNALPPVITNMALYLPAFVGGIIVVEQVFTWGGLGNAFNTGVATGDFGLLQAVLLMTTTVVVIANLLADIAYGWLDPRVRYDD